MCVFASSVPAESHQVLAQLLDTLLVIGTQLPESPTVRQRLIEVACKVTHRHTDTHTETQTHTHTHTDTHTETQTHTHRHTQSVQSNRTFCTNQQNSSVFFSLSSSQHLSDTYFGVRNKCLQLLGCLGMLDTPLTKDNEGLGTALGLCHGSVYLNG